MKKFGIYYGSTTGTTGAIARQLGKLLDVDDSDIHDVGLTPPHTVAEYEVLVFGSSTHGDGEMQDDWYSFLDGLQALDLSGKRIAIFGCGNQTMSRTFCNAIGLIYHKLINTGATFIGEFPADGYTFESSLATDGATMRGLVLDQDNHPELTDQRLALWARQLKDE